MRSRDGQFSFSRLKLLEKSCDRTYAVSTLIVLAALGYSLLGGVP